MAPLSSQTPEHVLRFVADAEEFGGDHAFTPEVLMELGKLVESDWVAYDEADRVRRRFGYGVDRRGTNTTDRRSPTGRSQASIRFAAGTTLAISERSSSRTS